MVFVVGRVAGRVSETLPIGLAGIGRRLVVQSASMPIDRLWSGLMAYGILFVRESVDERSFDSLDMRPGRRCILRVSIRAGGSRILTI